MTEEQRQTLVALTNRATSLKLLHDEHEAEVTAFAREMGISNADVGEGDTKFIDCIADCSYKGGERLQELMEMVPSLINKED